jgi:putative DNA primase/helicase
MKKAEPRSPAKSNPPIAQRRIMTKLYANDSEAAAADYRERGLATIPLKRRSKEPKLPKGHPFLARKATDEEFGGFDLRHNVGIVTGKVSGIIVLDDDDDGETIKANNWHVPATPTVKTKRGHQYYFRCPEAGFPTFNVAGKLEVRGDGAYVVAPPSIHPSGGRYEWVISPDEARVAEPPAWLLEQARLRARRMQAEDVGEMISNGSRNKTLFSIAGTLRRRGLDEASIAAALLGINATKCETPLDEAEVRKIAASAARYEPADNVVSISPNGHSRPQPPRGYNLTDLGNAERFIAQHGANVRYCYAWSRWLVFTGARWERDESGHVHRLAKETVRGIYQEAAATPDEERRKALGKHAAKSEAETKIRGMLELAKSEAPISPDELDGDPWLLNAPNGTLDLRTGELREHRREDLLTKMAGADYHPTAEAPLWTATLERVLPSPALRAFFKKLCGYAITGDVSEHILAVLYGTGANGKSTILNALLEAANDYGMQAAPDLLVAKKGAHPTEVADLFGKRLVASIEVEDGRRLAESLVKQLTGGDKVRARRMRQDFWQFDPTHKVFMAVNHKPEVRGTDTAIWRRIRLIPFTETIPPGEQDKKLPEKLRGELSGILAWVVEGCLEWRREGLQAPEEVRKATGQYRSEMDVIGAFLQDECAIGADYREPFATVYKRYEEWCEDGGERAETRRKFNARLKERGRFEARRSGPGGANEWHGLRLLKKRRGPFAGKLKQRTEKDHNHSENTASRPNSENNFSSSVASAEEPPEPLSSKLPPGVSATLEQLRRIEELERQGFGGRGARMEVLAKGHPLGCDCAVCS